MSAWDDFVAQCREATRMVEEWPDWLRGLITPPQEQIDDERKAGASGE